MPAGRGPAAALLLAKEWGMTDLEQRLQAAIDADWEPTWDEERAEFTWGLGLDEAHPRGQFNAFLAAAEAGGAGRWHDVANRRITRGPQIVDVDFPDVALSRAEWIDEALYLRLEPRVEDPTRRTMFRLVGAEPRIWYITGIDGVTMDTAGSAVILRAPMVRGDIVLTPGSY